MTRVHNYLLIYLTLCNICAALDGALDSDIVPDIDVASGTFTKDLGAQWQKVGRMGSVGGGHSSVSPTKSQEALSDGVNLLDQSSQEPLLQETTFDDNPMNVRNGFTIEYKYNYLTFSVTLYSTGMCAMNSINLT